MASDARDFMKLLMPSHARRVKHYADPVPLFQRYGAEDQLTAMYDPVVQLKSGGYIVINPTEALVSIDINSGRSTKEHGIEQTAVATNLEAAREIARQLRLRDMAGLVVIDFIDMEYGSNVRKVEKAMKEALKNDRARIQVGRISSFGLMEMSRQRLRTGVLEATTRSCPHCDGTGLVRTAGSAGLSALRLIEEEAAKGKGTTITLFASQEAAIYVLNSKRADLHEIEERYRVEVEVIPEGENEGAKMRVISSGPRNEFVPTFTRSPSRRILRICPRRTSRTRPKRPKPPRMTAKARTAATASAASVAVAVAATAARMAPKPPPRTPRKTPAKPVRTPRTPVRMRATRRLLPSRARRPGWPAQAPPSRSSPSWPWPWEGAEQAGEDAGEGENVVSEEAPVEAALAAEPAPVEAEPAPVEAEAQAQARPARRRSWKPLRWWKRPRRRSRPSPLRLSPR
jgi:ribonuclease E